MNFLDKLNPEQREAVLHRDGPAAHPRGGGLGQDARHHVSGSRTSSAMVTPSPGRCWRSRSRTRRRRKCASASRRSSASAAEGVWLSTFHSLCARLLRREAPKIGLSRDFVIYDSSDQVAVVKQAERELGIDDKLVPPRVALSRISQAKNRMEGPESLRGAWNFRDEQIAKIYERYLTALKDANALDFDDLLLKTVELFETSEQTREFYAQKFRYVMVDEYQDTNRPQYLLIRRLAEAHRNLAVVGDPDQSIYKWRGADLRNILDFEQDFGEAKIVRLEQNYRSTQTILDAASAVISQNRNRKDKRLWTDRKGGSKIIYFRGNDELEEADFITRSIKQFRSEDVDATMAMLYRTNAQSRAIEDSLMREGIPYKIIGGVRFYERKEIKDALAYLKLIINPHDDVSLRRVINVPARGIGKGVMDSLQAIDPDAVLADAPPLLAAGLQEVSSARSLWAKLVYAVDDGKLAPRATASLRVFRDLIAGLADVARQDPVSIAIGKMLDQTGYLKDLRDENTEEANERIENLMELVSAAREYETREPEASLGGFVDRLSLLSEVGRRVGHARREGLDDDDARGQGAGVPARHHRRPGGRPVPALALERGRGGARGGAPALLRRDDARAVPADAHQRGAPAGVRRVPVHRAVAVPRRDSGGARRADRRRRMPRRTRARFSHAHYEFRTNPYGRRDKARGRVREVETRPTRTRTRISQRPTLRPGMRVRHAQFGVGTVVAVEEHNDDLKITVRFNSVGVEEAAGEVREARTGVDATVPA